METRRFAPHDVAARYPYPVLGPVAWRQVSGTWLAEVPLPALQPDDLVVPSFAMLTPGEYGFQFRLHAGEASWSLAPVAMPPREDSRGSARVSTQIDYYQTHEALDGAVLELAVTADHVEGMDYLLTITIRPRRVSARAGERVTAPIAVRPVSQLTAPRPIRRRICSPTCINMVLSHHGISTHNGELTALCHHAASQMYGVWPVNLWAASRKGALGAVELFESLDDAAPALAARLPVVASIRYGAGELPGAPLAATGGHLVVVTRLDEETVEVNDPASPRLETVPRRYARTAFAHAWLTERGAAYILLPPSPPCC